jgi:hypothetical protein
MFHVVLSTVGITLLVSLVTVYTKTYWETHARFSLGLVVVLLALLMQLFVQYRCSSALLGPSNLSKESSCPALISSR